MSEINPKLSLTTLSRPLVVLGAEGFLGRYLIAEGVAHGSALGISHREGRSLSSMVSKLKSLASCPILIHAAGGVSKISAPSEEAYVRSTVRLFQAAALAKPDATVITLGSIIETLEIQTAYAQIKRRQRELARQASLRFNLKWIHVLLHNPVGPGQACTQVAGATALRLVEAIRKGESFIRITNADAVRDWIDVRDAARIIVTLAKSSHLVDRNYQVEVCTGFGHSVLALAEAIVRASGANIRVVGDNSYCQLENGGFSVVGNPKPLRYLIGALATPRYKLEQSMNDVWHAVAVRKERFL